MSPVSLHGYRVRFVDWAQYEIEVLADSEQGAVAKAQQIAVREGSDAFKCITGANIGWDAKEMQS